ncbi:DUF4469 domain-containing protein [Aliifodinibius sp. S!AR15-10]|uniref:DUF4469 domain-containing protein n=1 Tax=Aliifodinibius sp. S!AR15-10 TaxID=2950437 RepID=UPI0028607399|nr:DUF4469 domain-containing protein [Aliifodinibius sp. S!AR15-10]MDR8394201.1 DUF4469 domain-containing protein [Aliifodinibius sp. S!AR15-10]
MNPGPGSILKPTETEAKAEQVRTNEPKTLTLRIPESRTAGSWRIEVRNTAYNSATL